MKAFTVFLWVIQAVYLLSLFYLALYGLNNLITTILFWRTPKPPRRARPYPAGAELPFVTIQLPTFNERYTVERLLNAVAGLQYPRDRLQVQVLDDSTDDTTLLLRRLVEQHRQQGLDIELIHRVDRRGFKAGALAAAMPAAKGELLAIFDADFVPEPDWLLKVVPEFQDPRIGCLQTRWGHLNNTFSPFTRAQALGIDGHFMIEQTARSQHGFFLNFNGTAGLWRRACIVDAGGWQPDTLTEDLDLSYRAQLRGWRIGYLPDVVVPAEVPATIEAFKHQQFRWAKGTFQVVRKITPRLLKAEIPERVRLMALIHITGYSAHPLMVLILLVMLPIGVLNPSFFHMFPWTILASFGPPLLYLSARTEYAPRLIDRLKLIPLLLLMGFGLSLNNTIAVLQGLFGSDQGTFERTPKLNLADPIDRLHKRSYDTPISPMIWGELGLMLYALITLIVLGERVGWALTPWLLTYVLGYAYMAGSNLYQRHLLNHPKASFEELQKV